MTQNPKLKGGMLLLTVLGGLLMLPPLVHVFDQDIIHFGMPQIVFYLFGLWLALILGTAWLARGVARPPSGVDPGDGER